MSKFLLSIFLLLLIPQVFYANTAIKSDSIPSGISFQIKGKIVSIDTLPVPTRLSIPSKIISTKTSASYPVLTKTVPFPKASQEIIMGENGVPFPTTEIAKPIKKRLPLSPSQSTLPLSYLDKKNSPFQYLDVPQGLPTPFIRFMIPTKNGQYWMGSDPYLIQYDGKTIRAMNTSIQSTNRIFQDREENLWIYSVDYKGLIKYDGNYYYEFDNSIQQDRILAMFQDSKQNLWFLNDYVVYKFDGISFTRYSREILPFLKKIYENNFFLEDQQKNIWLRTVVGTLLFQNDRFLLFDEKKMKGLRPLLEDQNGLIWFNYDQQLCAYQNDSLVCFSTTLMKQYPIYSATAIDSNHILLTYSHDKENKQIIANTLLNTKTLMERPYRNLPSEYYTSMIDQFENIWYCVPYNGVHRYNPNAFNQAEFGLNTIFYQDNITSLLEDHRKNIWFAPHHNALYKFDGKHYHQYELKGVKRSLLEDQKGNIWIGGGNLYKFDGQYFYDYSIDENNKKTVFTITEDQEGNIWYGGNSNQLTKFNGQSFIHYELYPTITKDRTGYKDIRTLLTDQKGNIWIATQSMGLYRFDGQSFIQYTTKEGLSSNQIISLMEDQAGNIWIGTYDGGLNRFDGQQFTAYTTKEGLSSNRIWTITEDPQGSIWVGADQCLNQMVFEAGALKRIGEYCDMGGEMKTEFFANSTLLDNEGKMWWGTESATIIIDTKYQPIFEEAPSVSLSEVRLNQQFVDFRILSDSIAAGKDWWLDEDEKINLNTISFDSVVAFQNCPLNLKLPHYLNSLSFQFSGRHHPNLHELKFSFFIESVDQNWSPPSLNNTAEYRSLNTGTYTLKVKAAGNENIWSPPFEYTFIILPPWWQTTWAYALWIGIVLTFIYFLYRYLLRQRLKEAEASRLLEMDRLKTNLYNNITHEFRTPLTIITGISDTIKGNDEEKNIIKRNSNDLLQLVNQMLDLSKLEAGELQLNYIQADIISFLGYLTDSFLSMARDKEIHLTFYSEIESLMMDFDEQKLQHVVYNLLSNSIKFTSYSGRVVLHVKGEGKKLQIRVKDNGVGIAKEHLSHIFNRFYQADTGLNRVHEGTGIGLALTKDLVELMEGTIHVKSQLEKGTEFTIQLPIKREAPTKAIQALEEEMIKQFIPVATTPSNGSTTKASIDPDKASLLVIEDNRDITNYLKLILKNTYNIQNAIDGNVGFQLATEQLPDIIISDVMLPHKNGFELCAELKQDRRTSHIPVILLTGLSAEKDRIEGLNSGADAFLTKPFNKEELMIRLENLVTLRKELQSRYATQVSDNLKVSDTSSLEDTFLTELKVVIEEKMNRSDFQIADLAEGMNMSQVQIYRKLKALTGRTPSQFVRAIRLQKGKELVLNSELTISEIAYEVGFADPSYFTRTFQKEFGKTPRELR